MGQGASVPRFLELPVEIQILIWKCAFVSVPYLKWDASNFKVLAQPKRIYLHPRQLPSTYPWNLSGLSISYTEKGMQCILQACHRSRLTTFRTWRQMLLKADPLMQRHQNGDYRGNGTEMVLRTMIEQMTGKPLTDKVGEIPKFSYVYGDGGERAEHLDIVLGKRDGEVKTLSGEGLLRWNIMNGGITMTKQPLFRACWSSHPWSRSSSRSPQS